MIDDEGLAWVEEPIVYDNLDGYPLHAIRCAARDVRKIPGAA
jgi:hypothetical protein